MAQLAKRYDGRTITRLDELAQREAVSANFLDAGTYTIRCLASDGALNTAKDVVVTVTK